MCSAGRERRPISCRFRSTARLDGIYSRIDGVCQRSAHMKLYETRSGGVGPIPSRFTCCLQGLQATANSRCHGRTRMQIERITR
eukprot:14604292-Alexandrium_andersonii.AAC.1